MKDLRPLQLTFLVMVSIVSAFVIFYFIAELLHEDRGVNLDSPPTRIVLMESKKLGDCEIMLIKIDGQFEYVVNSKGGIIRLNDKN